jgi:hypothetical protein
MPKSRKVPVRRSAGPCSTDERKATPYADDPTPQLEGNLQNDDIWWRASDKLHREREFVELLREINQVWRLRPKIGEEWGTRVRGLAKCARNLGIFLPAEQPGEEPRINKDATKYYRNRLKISCGFRWVKCRHKTNGKEQGKWLYCGNFAEAQAKDLYFPLPSDDHGGSPHPTATVKPRQAQRGGRKTKRGQRDAIPVTAVMATPVVATPVGQDAVDPKRLRPSPTPAAAAAAAVRPLLASMPNVNVAMDVIQRCGDDLVPVAAVIRRASSLTVGPAFNSDNESDLGDDIDRYDMMVIRRPVEIGTKHDWACVPSDQEAL